MRRNFQATGIGLAMAVIVAGGAALRVSGGDALLHSVYKRQLFTQADAGAPTPQSCGSVFCALVEVSGSNSVASAKVSSSSGVGGGLTAQYEEEFLPSRWIYSLLSSFPDKEALDAAWMNGEFSFAIACASDGPSAPTLHLSGDAYPANPPHIRNFDDAQAVDASKAFVLGWEGFEEGTTNDFVFVSIRRMPEETTVFSTPFLEEPGRLDGTATVISIPAGTLKSGSEYLCYVRLDKVISRTRSGTAGGAGVASYSKGTHFSLKTR